MKKHGFCSGSVRIPQEGGDAWLDCEWEVTDDYSPAVFYERNGDPGHPEEHDFDWRLISVQGWDANLFLEHLEFFNPKAKELLLDAEPDFSETRWDEEGE